jgi:hypothetical protein
MRGWSMGVATSAVLAMIGDAPSGKLAESPLNLSIESRQPVIYDNDGVVESGYNDQYIMALASAGRINLRGMITTGSYGEEARTPPFSPYPEDALVAERQWIIDVARRSGMRNIPNAIAGPTVSFDSRKPASGIIEHTMPIGSPAGWLIVREARAASRQRPLVVVMGGQATAVADAYLLDPSIADKMLVLWGAGNKRKDGDLDGAEFNMTVDAWAGYIASQRLPLVLFPYSPDGDGTNDPKPYTPKSRLWELPDTELRQVTIDAYFDRGGYIDDFPYAFDSDPIVALTRGDYVLQTKRMAVDHWVYEPTMKKWIPYLTERSDGLQVVWTASQAIATEEWWAWMKNPAAWGPVNPFNRVQPLR